MSENSMVIFSRAALMLAEADTIQKAKELKSLAMTAADWAKRKGMGEAAIQHCRSYALEAERKMGEMLKDTERAKPPNPHPPKERRLHDVTDVAPTLAGPGPDHARERGGATTRRHGGSLFKFQAPT